MASSQIPIEPLDPILNIWEEECQMFTERLKRSNPHVEFNLIAYKEFIYLDLISVAENYRNSGLGTKFMKELAALADSVNCPLALTPDTSYGASDEAKLEDFYMRFGFIKNIGKDRDFSTMQTMIRPRKN
jgi:GNAT superfamily N-acetyltransferase